MRPAERLAGWIGNSLPSRPAAVAEALEGGVAGQVQQRVAAAHTRLDLPTLPVCGGVHPDWRCGAGKDALQLVSQRLVGIETAQRRGGGGAEIDGAVLLAAAGDRGDPA